MTRLLETVDRSRREGRLAVKTERGTKLMSLADIHWVESDSDLVKIHTARGALVHRATLTEMEAQLPAAVFARVHRSAIVNINWISEVQPMFKGDYVIVLKTGAAVRTGRTYRARVQALMA